MKKVLLFLAVVLMGLNVMAQSTYTKVTSVADLSVGDKVLFVGFNDDNQAYVMSYQKSNNRHAVNVAVNGDVISTTVATDPSNQTDPYAITIGMDGGNWTFYDEVKGGYLYAAGGGNYLKTQTSLDEKGQWTLSMDGDGFVPTSNGGVEQNIMRYNPNTQNQSPLFGCYKSNSNVTGLVYIYKEGGGTINPEPSNYPTNFMALAVGANVLLEWDDAMGAQLPKAYAIIGSTGSITVPVDGTPISNDLNGADGHVAYNVMYGEESYIFESLPGNTSWTFAIFPYTNSGANIDYKNEGNYPVANATTGDIYTLLSTDFSNGLAPFTAVNVSGEQGWNTGVYNGTTYAVMNGYSGGSTYANEDWLISPDLFANGKYETMRFSFSNAYKFEGNPLLVMISREYDGMSDPNQFEWADITEEFEWSTGNYTWQESGEMIFEDIEADHFYIAFVYICNSTSSSAWEITNVEVYGSGFDAVEENKAVTFNVYPNPATSLIRINADDAAVVEVLDMAGRMVMSVNVAEGENTINVSELADGVYFVRMNGTVVKFVKR